MFIGVYVPGVEQKERENIKKYTGEITYKKPERFQLNERRGRGDTKERDRKGIYGRGEMGDERCEKRED